MELIIFTSSRHADLLDKASGISFFIGVIFAKSQYLVPIPYVATILNAIGLSLYLLGYIKWLISVQITGDNRQNHERWFGRTSMKLQFTVASVLGLLATALGIAAIFFPVLIIPTCWLFTTSNLFWFVGEYHKASTVPDDPYTLDHYTPSRQLAYLKYVKIVVVISALTSLLMTFAFLFPAFLLVTLLIGPYLGGIAIKAWVDMTFFKPHEARDAQTNISASEFSLSNTLDRLSPTSPPAPRPVPPQRNLNNSRVLNSHPPPPYPERNEGSEWVFFNTGT